MADIKLFVCCHKEERVPPHELLKPVQVGAVLTDERFNGFFYDGEGENISAKNRSYCELTAQYWAWKNTDADYYGFFHYRRFLYPCEEEKQPYRIERMAEPERLEKLGYGGFAELIEKYDLIAPVGEDMHVSVREHYANAPYHHRKDLELVEQIVREQHPEMEQAMEAYLSGTVCYFGNIYIMKQKIFRHYCDWLFPVLEEFDRRADVSGYSVQELRADGYLAERLFGIWLTHVRGDLRVCELPRVHFVPEKLEYGKKKLLNMLLPPGSRRRAVIKKMRRLG